MSEWYNTHQLLPNGQAIPQPLQDLFDRYRRSGLREPVEQSDGIRLGSFFPYRHLSAKWIDTSSKAGIVMNQGDILAAAGPLVGNASLVGVLDYPNSAITLPLYTSAVDGSYVGRTQWDGGLVGYEDSMGSVIVPANGGYASLIYWTAADVELGTFKPKAGNPAAWAVVTTAGTSGVSLPANQPVGVAFQDWYQDGRGRYRSNMGPGDTWRGFICDGYIAIPYVNTVAFEADEDYCPRDHYFGWAHGVGKVVGEGPGNTIYTSDTAAYAYPDVARLHSFLYTIPDVNAGGLLEGALLTSDLYGKWTPQYNGLSTSVAVALTGLTMETAVTVADDALASIVATLTGDVTSNEEPDPTHTFTLGAGTVTHTVDPEKVTATTVFGEDAAATVTLPAMRTNQTVGKLVEVATHYPKDMMDMVDTPGGHRVAGTSTGGVPVFLFNFCWDAIQCAGGTPTVTKVVNGIRTGKFGLARIQVQVA